MCACVFWCENAIYNFNNNDNEHHSNSISGDEFFLTYFGNFYLSCWSVCFSHFHPTQRHTQKRRRTHTQTSFVQRFYVCDFWCVVKYTHKSLCSTNSHTHMFECYYLCLVSHCLFGVLCVMLFKLHLQ